ncbi:MAG: hypothetical protein WAM82_16940 [Thermoanaerobaculia bacterium]
MLFPKLTEGQKREIARQVAELIDAFTNEGKLGGAVIPSGLSLFESCRELILDLPRQWAEILRSQESDHIEQWRRPQVTWYHQLRTTGEVFGFARSVELNSSEGGGHRVIEVVPSTVAQEFQKAIDVSDAEESKNESAASESPSVLLHVPRYAFYGLATETAGAVSLAYPFFREQFHVSEQKLERGSFINLLSGLPSAFGALGSRLKQNEDALRTQSQPARGIKGPR